MKPTWQSTDGQIVLYLGDCLKVLTTLEGVGAVVTDPPYGIGYKSGMTGHDGGTALPGILGDEDTSLRDELLRRLCETPALVFGSWKRKRPPCSMLLIWEKGDHVGMGDLSIPWKPNTEEIYVIGRGFSGHRGSSVLRINAPVSWNSVAFGRSHAHEKPIALMQALVSKCPQGTILDPFMGSGTTGIACIQSDRQFIGIEIDPTFFAVAQARIERAWHVHHKKTLKPKQSEGLIF